VTWTPSKLRFSLPGQPRFPDWGDDTVLQSDGPGKFDAGGQMEFVGEDQIDRTPRNETIRVTTGNASDLAGERKQTNFRVDTGDKWTDESFEIKPRNRKKEAV
jgi:hypothetical protein